MKKNYFQLRVKLCSVCNKKFGTRGNGGLFCPKCRKKCWRVNNSVSITQFKKGHVPANKWLKGHAPWNKGLKYSEERKKRMSEISKITWQPPEYRIKMSKALKGKTGEKSPNWQGGITPEHKRIRNSVDFVKWRTSVYIRDDWTCQKCRVKCELNSHHILNFSQYPELRFDANNGISLCINCHLLFHNLYGRQDNTREQLSYFLCEFIV
jgi:hypothetical protein